MSLNHLSNTMLEPFFNTEKNQFLNILKRIKYRYEHQSSACSDFECQAKQVEEISPSNFSLETHVPAMLLKEPRRSVAGIVRNRRNCYNFYSLLENQQIEQNFAPTPKLIAPSPSQKQKIQDSFQQLNRFPKLKQLKISISATPTLKVRKEEQRKSTTVLCNVSKLKNTLKVNKKLISRTTKEWKKQNGKQKESNNNANREIKYSVYEKSDKSKRQGKMTTFFNYIKHEQILRNDLTSWNSQEDHSNSFQNLIF